MYAIIATGGKQYKVDEGDVIKVEKLGVEACLLYTSKVIVVVPVFQVIFQSDAFFLFGCFFHVFFLFCHQPLQAVFWSVISGFNFCF